MELITWILIGAALAFVLYIPFPFVIKCVMRTRFLSTVGKSGFICLTFDDGPCPEATPQILAILKQNGIKATFFLVGEKVVAYPGLTDKILADGHQVGEHSYSHSHPWKCSPWRSAVDLIKGGHVFKRYQVLRQSIYFRPPYGKFNLLTLLYVWITKKQVAFWDIDPQDYRDYSGREIAQKAIAQLHTNSIVLLHDGRNNANDSVNTVTVNATNLILEAAPKNTRRFVTIAEAIAGGKNNNAP